MNIIQNFSGQMPCTRAHAINTLSHNDLSNIIPFKNPIFSPHPDNRREFSKENKIKNHMSMQQLQLVLRLINKTLKNHKTMKLAIISLLTIALNSCGACSSSLNTGKDENGNIRKIEASEKMATKTESIAKFDKISTDITAKIVFIQDNSGKSQIEIKGNENILDIIKYEVSDNTLSLSHKKGYKVEGKTNITVTLTSPQLTQLRSKGVGTIEIESLETPAFSLDSEGVGSCELGTIKTGICNVNNKGVGSVDIKKLTAKEIEFINSGVGSISAGGSADNAKYKNSGVGSIEAGGLKCKTVDASNSGVGSIECNASVKAVYKKGGLGTIDISGEGEKIKR